MEFEQGSWAGNIAEEHNCLLTSSDFPDLVASKRNGVTTCYVSTNKANYYNTVIDAAITCPVCKPEKIPLLIRKIKNKIKMLLYWRH